MAHHTTDGCTVEWDGPLGAVVADWTSDPAGDPFRESLEAALDRLVDREAEKLLVDAHDAAAPPTSDCEWLRDDLLPRAEAEGLSAVAVACPSGAVDDVATALLTDDSEATRNVFGNGDAARVWLLEQ